MKLLSRKIESSSGDYTVFFGTNLVLGATELSPLSLISEMELSIARESIAAELKPLISRAPLVAVVSQQPILTIYRDAFELFLTAVCDCGGIALGAPKVHYYTIKEGEENKTLATVESLYTCLIADGATRDSLIIALGGGIVGDVAGYVAATLLRGIAWVNIPTTLLAQVDASIGGKTGVNLGLGKNLVGAFHPPRQVVVDPFFLGTLSKREFLSGVGEVIKYGAGISPVVSHLIHSNLDEVISLVSDIEQPGSIVEFHCIEESSFPEIIWESLQTKADIVTLDEKEGGQRKVLNLGHTIGHAIEGAFPGVMTHGEAVAAGVKFVALLSLHLSIGNEEFLNDIIFRIDSVFSFPKDIRDIHFSEIEPYLNRDKKRCSSGLVWVLPLSEDATTFEPTISLETLQEVWGTFIQSFS